MRVAVIKACVVVLGSCLVTSSVSAQAETLDVHAYLPLFDRNSIARKVLDMRYSAICKGKRLNKSYAVHSDGHLVFDAATGMYRSERRYYSDPADTNSYKLTVEVWNGKEHIEWKRDVDGRPGFRALGAGIYEAPGTAMIRSRPLGDTVVPSTITFFFAVFPRTWAETVPDQNPKLGRVTEGTITIETEGNTFLFSKKTGALEKIDARDKGGVYYTVRLSNHVESSGVWIPLRIIEIIGKEEDGNVSEISVERQTLRVLDKAGDDAVFRETLPVGCYVGDEIKKTGYWITTLDNPPPDVEALKKTLDKMLEQAEEQKAAVEKKK